MNFNKFWKLDTSLSEEHSLDRLQQVNSSGTSLWSTIPGKPLVVNVTSHQRGVNCRFFTKNEKVYQGGYKKTANFYIQQCCEAK